MEDAEEGMGGEGTSGGRTLLSGHSRGEACMFFCVRFMVWKEELMLIQGCCECGHLFGLSQYSLCLPGLYVLVLMRTLNPSDSNMMPFNAEIIFSDDHRYQLNGHELALYLSPF